MTQGEQTTPESDINQVRDGASPEDSAGRIDETEQKLTPDGGDGKTRLKRRSSKSSKASTLRGAARPHSAASSRQPVQKVVYYQNRFITVTIDPVTGKVVETGGPVLNTGGAGAGSSVNTGGGGKTPGKDAGGGPRGATGGRPGPAGAETQRRTTGGMSAIEIDAMQHDPPPGGSGGGGIAGRPPGMGPPPAGKAGRFGRFKVPSCLKTCHMYLQDNRMKTGSAATKEKLKDNNKMQDSQNLCLKKVLNIIFVTTGVSLFLAVVIVIIYTSIGE